ncbi:MAG: hypothetical protein Ct9H300mP28_33740 [Pseudomonadota bacterium]|nr:MAG: hypothetical protein Ct9H300mP28_33740 [Pseudomonadota bacterium]
MAYGSDLVPVKPYTKCGSQKCCNNPDKQTVLSPSYPSVGTNSRDTWIRTITNQHFVPAQRVRFGFECKHLRSELQKGEDENEIGITAINGITRKKSTRHKSSDKYSAKDVEAESHKQELPLVNLISCYQYPRSCHIPNTKSKLQPAEQYP